MGYIFRQFESKESSCKNGLNIEQIIEIVLKMSVVACTDLISMCAKRKKK